MTPMMSQVRAAGSNRLPVRVMRISAAARKMTPRMGKMYLVATMPQFICVRSRCWRQAGALVLKSTVPGLSRQR